MGSNSWKFGSGLGAGSGNTYFWKGLLVILVNIYVQGQCCWKAQSSMIHWWNSAIEVNLSQM